MRSTGTRWRCRSRRPHGPRPPRPLSSGCSSSAHSATLSAPAAGAATAEQPASRPGKMGLGAPERAACRPEIGRLCWPCARRPGRAWKVIIVVVRTDVDFPIRVRSHYLRTYRCGWHRPFVSSCSPRARIACYQRCLRILAPTADGCGHSEPWGLQRRQTTSPNSAVARPCSPTATSVSPSGNAGNSQIMGRPETWRVRSSGFGSPQRLRDRRWPSLLLASWTSNGAERRRRAPVSASSRGDEALCRGEVVPGLVGLEVAVPHLSPGRPGADAANTAPARATTDDDISHNKVRLEY